MKLRLVLAGLALSLMTIAASAQVGLYVNPVGTNISNSKIDNSDPFSFLGPNTTSRTFWGANLGGYYELYHGEKANVGIDLRDSIVKANNASLNSFLVGARVSAKPIAERFKPYAQFSFGAGSSKAPTTKIRVTRLEYNIYGGLDYALNSHVDFRAVEIGYGSVPTINAGDFGEANSISSSRLLNFSTGLVFHFGAPAVIEKAPKQ